MAKKRKPRMCSTFHCDRRGDRYCCADCSQKPLCKNPCLNDPSRCGLEDQRPGKPASRHSITKFLEEGGPLT